MNGLPIYRMTSKPAGSLRFLIRGLLVGAPLLTTACTTPAPPPVGVEGEHSLSVTVATIGCCQGALHIALYASPEHWLKDDGIARGQVTPVVAERQVFEFAGLAPGRYALAVYQDLDQDAELDFLLSMIPREPYGFSNDSGGLRPPDFDRAAVQVNSDTRTAIRLRKPPLWRVPAPSDGERAVD